MQRLATWQGQLFKYPDIINFLRKVRSQGTIQVGAPLVCNSLSWISKVFSKGIDNILLIFLIYFVISMCEEHFGSTKHKFSYDLGFPNEPHHPNKVNFSTPKLPRTLSRQIPSSCDMDKFQIQRYFQYIGTLLGLVQFFLNDLLSLSKFHR